MYFIAYKSLFRRKLRTFLASVGVSIGVILLVVVLSVMLGMSSMLDELSLAIVGDIGVLEDGEMDLSSVLDKDTENLIRRIPGVTGTVARVYGYVKIEGAETKPLGGLIDEDMISSLPEEFQSEMGGARIVGVDPSKELLMNTYVTDITRGVLFSKGASGVCVIGMVLVEETGFDIGDRITLVFDKDSDGVEPSDKHDFRIVGIYDSGSELADGNIIMSMEDAQEIKGFRSDEISRIDVRADPKVEEDVIRKMKMMLPNTEVGGTRSMLGMMNTFTENIDLMTVLMIGFSGMISLFFILIIMITSVMERTKEIGVLRATGWYKSDVIKLILVESVLLAVMGTSMGAVMGIGALLAIHEIFPGVQVIITPLLIAIVISFGLIVGSVAGLYPAYRAASLSPLEAFSGGDS
ncbi:MAG: FtsX-like permease family protein [Halobacteriota archaeon]|nr:FtsX-like permease family protein [Halobacteriota archaeon]